MRVPTGKALPYILALSIFALLSSYSPSAAGADRLVGYAIKPSAVDPGVKNFDEPSYVLFDPKRSKDSPLVVFLTGTGGAPRGVSNLLTEVALQGYRVIGLEYNDLPAVSEVCPQDPDLACSEAFRSMRIEGQGASSKVSNPPSETIVARLIMAIRALDRNHPNEGWGRYLGPDGPAWDRMIVSGMSQGAGMAAYIAKFHRVERVVLFSSPWDYAGPRRQPAPWLSAPSATPPDRWYAEYHRREITAEFIKRAYTALSIPDDHIQVFDLDIAPGSLSSKSPNPFHVDTVVNPGYAAQRREMFGQAAVSAAAP